ncbi:hypothetical protein ACQEVZ_29795 [Dactylosporangium sp. CA-152071]|uniref:hypothetical protein n=1 Tax=Dactylosporangium sp. CA-152071 TaxID=3239933 RepID=UPI003D92AA9E
MTSEPHAACAPAPIGADETTTRWAEEATFDPNDPTVELGEVAAGSGRTLLHAAHIADEQVPGPTT